MASSREAPDTEAGASGCEDAGQPPQTCHEQCPRPDTELELKDLRTRIATLESIVQALVSTTTGTQNALQTATTTITTVCPTVLRNHQNPQPPSQHARQPPTAHPLHGDLDSPHPDLPAEGPQPSQSPTPNQQPSSSTGPPPLLDAPTTTTSPNPDRTTTVFTSAADAARAAVTALAIAAPGRAPPCCEAPTAVPVSSPPSVPFAVAMAATRVVMHQLVLPADVNQLGICTGGQVLSWIDLCAGLSAKTLAHGPCVTASVDAVHFLRPCRLGCVVIIAAMVARTFNTSMEVAVVVESEDMRTGVRHHCCSAHLTFVVRGGGGGGPAAGAPAGLPRVYPTSAAHRAMWEGAEVRRQLRLERRTRVRRSPELQDAERICRLQPITHREGGPTLPPAVTLKPGQLSHHSSQQYPSPQRPLSRQTSAAGASIANLDAAAAAAAAVLPGFTTAAAAANSEPFTSPLQPPPPPPPRRQRVPPSCTTAYMTQSILPQHANTLNITFGGQVMSWVEQCAYISASRLRAPALLTAAMDSVTFVKPTRVGDILYITAQVSAIFGSSLEVMVSVFGESPFSGAVAVSGGGPQGPGGVGQGGGGDAATPACDIFHCADAYVTVVAVDERHATPVPVPFELDPREHPEVLRHQGALARRAERLALRGEFAAAEGSRLSLDGGLTYSPPTEPDDAISVLDTMPPL